VTLQATVHNTMTSITLGLGEIRTAREHNDLALARARETGNYSAEFEALLHRCALADAEGRHGDAVASARAGHGWRDLGRCATACPAGSRHTASSRRPVPIRRPARYGYC
jgi:hypothetical protein